MSRKTEFTKFVGIVLVMTLIVLVIVNHKTPKQPTGNGDPNAPTELHHLEIVMLEQREDLTFPANELVRHIRRYQELLSEEEVGLWYSQNVPKWEDERSSVFEGITLDFKLLFGNDGNVNGIDVYATVGNEGGIGLFRMHYEFLHPPDGKPDEYDIRLYAIANLGRSARTREEIQAKAGEVLCFLNGYIQKHIQFIEDHIRQEIYPPEEHPEDESGDQQ